MGTIGVITNLSYLQKFFVWLIEEVVLLVAFAAIVAYGPSDVKEDFLWSSSNPNVSSHLDVTYGHSLLYAQEFCWR